MKTGQDSQEKWWRRGENLVALIIIAATILTGILVENGRGYFWFGGGMLALHYIYRFIKEVLTNIEKARALAELGDGAIEKMPVTLDYMEKQLKIHNCEVEAIEEGRGFYFTSHGINYTLSFSNKRALLICTCSCRSDINEEALADLAHRISCEILNIRIFARWDEENLEMQYVDILCQFHTATKAAFDSCFWENLHDMEIAIDRLYRGLDEIETKARPDHYNPVYKSIPMLIEAIASGSYAVEALTDEEWIRSNIQKRCQSAGGREEWNKFKINRVERYGDYKLIVYEFPEPKIAPEAKYGAILLNTQTLQADYYTLEMSVGGIWFYCGVTKEQHLNYGETEHNDLDHFIEWVVCRNKEVGMITNWATEDKPAEIVRPKNVN